MRLSAVKSQRILGGIIGQTTIVVVVVPVVVLPVVVVLVVVVGPRIAHGQIRQIPEAGTSEQFASVGFPGFG